MRKTNVLTLTGLFLVGVNLYVLTRFARADSNENDPSIGFTFHAVPGHVTVVPEAIVQHLAAALEQVNNADRQGNLEGSQQQLEEITAYCRQHLGQDHYLVHQYEAASVWYRWYSALSISQRASYEGVGAIIAEGEQQFVKADYDSAANKYLQATEVFERLKMPPFGDYAKYQLQLAKALCRSDQRREAILPACKGYTLAVSSDGEFSTLAADALCTLGEVHQSTGDYPRSLREFCRAFRILAACDPHFLKENSTSEDYVNALLQAADNLIAVGEYDRASRCIGEVTKLALARTPPANSLVCLVKRYEYYIRYYKGNYSDALSVAQEWLDFAQKSFAFDQEEVLLANTAKAEALLKLDRDVEANALISDILKIKFKDNPSHELKGGWLTDTIALADLAKHQYYDAIAVLEPCIQLEEREIGPKSPGLHDLLKPYADALHHVGRETDAKKAEDQLAIIESSLAVMRRQLDADPECKLPWEH